MPRISDNEPTDRRELAVGDRVSVPFDTEARIVGFEHDGAVTITEHAAMSGKRIVRTATAKLTRARR